MHYETTAKKLREAREKRGITQTKLGQKLGYHPQFVSNWERAKCMPPIKALKLISICLGIKKSELKRAYFKDIDLYFNSAWKDRPIKEKL